jgi:two-component system, cell cycle sensor histidine kinase and response regulator CckA
MTDAPPPRPATVLVVDDEAPLRRILERLLARDGYRVLTAGDAETAYQMLASEHADALLLDINLPGMSGLALYLAIVNRWPALEGRIALMSGDADAEDVAAWIEHHHCVVVRKPFDVRDVSRWVADVVRFRRRRTSNG